MGRLLARWREYRRYREIEHRYGLADFDDLVMLVRRGWLSPADFYRLCGIDPEKCSYRMMSDADVEREAREWLKARGYVDGEVSLHCEGE